MVDSESGKPMAYAVVILYRAEDTSKITGTYTDERGVFVLKRVKPGEYLLSADFVGYA
ncbi:MAG: carboxypeptidase-like regulatory domain-containing protein, partial [Thermotogae bacterium]|nr:carboxypeptidase-like regulatory domain-containing protein [Thermotogota bacterium]